MSPVQNTHARDQRCIVQKDVTNFKTNLKIKRKQKELRLGFHEPLKMQEQNQVIRKGKQPCLACDNRRGILSGINVNLRCQLYCSISGNRSITSFEVGWNFSRCYRKLAEVAIVCRSVVHEYKNKTNDGLLLIFITHKGILNA